MKKIHLYITLCLLMISGMMTNSLLSQRARYKPQVHEISIQLAEGSFIPDPVYDLRRHDPSSHYGLNYVNGLRYTFHLDTQHGFRVGGFYRNNQYNLPAEASQYDSYEATKKNIDFTLGYIYKVPFGASRVHFGVEGKIGFGKLDELGETIGNPNPYTAERAYKNIGANALIGYSYFLNTHISVGFEAAAYFSQLNYDKRTTTDIQPRDFFLVNEWGVNGSVYLSLHLGEMSKKCTCPKFR